MCAWGWPSMASHIPEKPHPKLLVWPHDTAVHWQCLNLAIILWSSTVVVGLPFPKMSVAKDGHSQAHMDVLVAVCGKGKSTAAWHIPSGYEVMHQ